MTGVVNEQPDLLEGTFYTQDPYPTYAWLREHDPVHWDATNRQIGRAHV